MWGCCWSPVLAGGHACRSQTRLFPAELQCCWLQWEPQASHSAAVVPKLWPRVCRNEVPSCAREHLTSCYKVPCSADRYLLAVPAVTHRNRVSLPWLSCLTAATGGLGRAGEGSSVCTAATGKEWTSTASGQPRRNGKKNRASTIRNVFVGLFNRLKVV